MEIGSLIVAFQYYQLQSLIWSWLAENASFTGRITETGTQFGQVDIRHSTDPICINCPRTARDLYENGPSSSLIRTFSSSAKRTSAPVKLRWSSNAHLDLEGKTVSKWKLEQNSRRKWEKPFKDHSFTRQSWPHFSVGLGVAVAAWQRLHHESTKLQYPSQ
jgi:hypothetical protein